jgi:hypothetical protein
MSRTSSRFNSMYGIGLGVALFGALVGAVQVQAGEDGGSGLLSGGSGWLMRTSEGGGEKIKAEPLTGSAQKSQVVDVLKAGAPASGSSSAFASGTGQGAGAAQGDNWLSGLGNGADKGEEKGSQKAVQNAAPSASRWASSSNANMAASERTVGVGQGLKPVAPGYATSLDAPYFWDKPVSMAAAPGTGVAADVSATQVSRRRSRTGTTFVAGNGYANIGGYGPRDFPAYQFPYAGFNNNPFTGLSSYSNGYAGGPPSAVPFAGGLHQGRSAYWSQPTMTVPNVNYGPSNIGGVGGAYGTGYGGPAIRVNGGYNSGGGGGGGPRRHSGGGSGSNVNVNVNYQQNQISGYGGYGYY